MKNMIIVLSCLFFMFGNAFATQKVYYREDTNFTIVDVSGKKPIADIKKEFGDYDYKTLTIDEKVEGFDVSNGNLVKVDLIAEAQAAKQLSEAEKMQREAQEEAELQAKIDAAVTKALVK